MIRTILLVEAASPENYNDLIATGHPRALARHIVKTQVARDAALAKTKERQERQTPEERAQEKRATARRSELAGRQSSGERGANEKQQVGTPWLTASILASSGFMLTGSHA